MKTNFLGDSGQNTFTMTQDIGPAPSLEAESAAAEQVEDVLLGIDGIETVQVSIGSSGSALRDAFSGGGSGITYSITTDSDADQVALREEVQEAVADLEDAGEITVAAGGGGFGSTDIAIDVTAPDSDTLQTATDAVVDAVDGAEGVGSGLEQPRGVAALHRRDGRPRQGGAARPVGGRGRRAGVEHDAAAVHRHGRDRRHVAHGVPRRLRDAGVARRAAAAAGAQCHGPHRARGGRDGRTERGPHLDHDRGRRAHVDRDGDPVDRRPRHRLRLGDDRPRGRRPARVGRRDARRRRDAAAGCVLAARPRPARGHPDRLHRHGRHLQVAAPAAAAARLRAVRGDRRDPAADHHGRAARRRVAHRRADAHRHRGDERDRARRPREPVPREGPQCARRDRRRWLSSSAPDPHDGAGHDLRADADGTRHHRSGRVHLAAARDRRDRRPGVVDRADTARAADAVQPRRGREGAARSASSRPRRRGRRRRRSGSRGRRLRRAERMPRPSASSSAPVSAQPRVQESARRGPARQGPVPRVPTPQVRRVSRVQRGSQPAPQARPPSRPGASAASASAAEWQRSPCR